VLNAASENLNHCQLLAEKLGDKVQHSVIANELTVVVPAAEYLAIAYLLRDDPDLRFEQLVDLTGLDYSTFSGQDFSTRFAVAVHLLSVSRNLRLRVRALAPDDSFPMLDSLCEVWPSANWFEREAFDLFGIVFRGHPDLRRI
jgi:NADH-quinone oxidoreductase subunit C